MVVMNAYHCHYYDYDCQLSHNIDVKSKGYITISATTTTTTTTTTTGNHSSHPRAQAAICFYPQGMLERIGRRRRRAGTTATTTTTTPTAAG